MPPTKKSAGAKKGGRRHKVKAGGTKKRHGVARKTKTKTKSGTKTKTARTQKRRKTPATRRRNYKKKTTSKAHDAGADEETAQE